MALTTLWGGPEDGLEVDVQSGTNEYTLDSPSDTNETRAQMLGVKGPLQRMPKQTACYRWNSITQRFEWKGYL
jgi:hypothetical protein